MEAAQDRASCAFCLRGAKVVMSWMNAICLAGGGGFMVFYNIAHWDDALHLILCIYLCLFGLVLGLHLAGINAVVQRFPYLQSNSGRAVYCFFVGTLGLAFGWETSPGERVIPFCLGLFSVCTCIIHLLYKCFGMPEVSDAYRVVENTYGSAAQTVSNARAGPNQI
jgi:hypothetical protein